LVGVNSVNMRGNGGAHSARSMLDVVLSLDTTGSLVSSNNLYDYTSNKGGTTVADAVTAFIQQINPTTTDPRGPKIGIGRYAGVKCTFVDANSNGRMDIYSGATPQSEYRAPCTDDETILTSLTNDQQLLLTIANNSGTATCPSSITSYACPIQHAPYILTYSPLYLVGYGQILPVAPYYTGTKEPNAICLVNPSDALCNEAPSSVYSAGFGWSTANGGRNCTSWPCPSGKIGDQARRVHIIMTDGQDEAFPTSYVNPINPDPAFPESIPGYDTNFKTLATNLKTNPAPDGGPQVEIYVVGYFCTGPPGVGPATYTSGTYPPNNFCQSSIAYQSVPRVCPGPSYTMSSTGSPVDDLLVSVSSSAPGTCDHYFPMSKNESLSTLFQDLAGTISRGQLTQ
jgi:hypothetical protein